MSPGFMVRSIIYVGSSGCRIRIPTDSARRDLSYKALADSTTGEPGLCGWSGGGYYDCGYEGVDPRGTPIECPPGLVESEPCRNTGLTVEGCCDALGVWYCGQGFVNFLAC